MPKLSVIIVTYNSANLIGHCLASVFQEIKKVKPQVVVVDNASTDKTAIVIKKQFPQVKFIQNKANVGFARAVNQAAKAASGEYLLLLNPDAILVPHSPDRLIDFLDNNKKAGIVGGQLIGLDRKIQSSFGNFPGYWTEFLEAVYLSRVFPAGRHILYNRLGRRKFKAGPKDWIAGGYTLIRKKLFDRLKGLDDNFFMYLEDVDFCRRARKLGYPAYYLPQAKVIHFRQASFGSNKGKAWDYADESLVYYFKKYGKSVAVARVFIWVRRGIKAAISYKR